MSELEQLLEVKQQGYDDWKEHISQMKKKYISRRNSPDVAKQSEAETVLSAIPHIEELLEKLTPTSEGITLAVKIVLNYCEHNLKDYDLSDLIKSCNEKDENSIKRVYKSNIDESLKKEWKRTIGKGILKEDRPKETPIQFIDRIKHQIMVHPRFNIIERVLKIIVLIIPFVFLLHLCIEGYLDLSGGPRRLFTKPMLFYAFIQYVCVVALKQFEKMEKLEIYMAIASGVAFILTFVPFVSNGLKTLNSDARLFFNIYIIAGAIIFYGACVTDYTVYIALIMVLVFLLGVSSCDKKKEKTVEGNLVLTSETVYCKQVLQHWIII